MQILDAVRELVKEIERLEGCEGELEHTIALLTRYAVCVRRILDLFPQDISNPDLRSTIDQLEARLNNDDLAPSPKKYVHKVEIHIRPDLNWVDMDLK